MTIRPVKYRVKQPVVVDGHRISDGIYVGQKISDTEIERQRNRLFSYFLHLATQKTGKGATGVQRFDLDVTDLVISGQIDLG